MSDSSGLADEVTSELNPAGPAPDNGPQAAPIPDRPADGASKDAWVDYVVALGADLSFVTTATTHWNAAEQGIEWIPPLRQADLIELADHLGG